MPYIITTTTPPPGIAGAGFGGESPPTVKRQAIATLDGARRVVRTRVFDAGHCSVEDAYTAGGNVPKAGGTVGPLPDGATITVAVVTDDQLRATVASKLDGAYSRPLDEIVDAYNTAQ